jgi:AcrR family transcriptional regulator
MVDDETDATLTDGRRLRGERTRQRVVEALIDLVEHGELRPSAQRVATKAKVALRTVYHHFEDIDALRATALRLEWQRHVDELIDLDASKPLDDRLALVIKQRRQLFEAITPIRQAALLTGNAPQVSEGLRESRQFLRDRVSDVFATEIAEAGSHGHTLLDALDEVLSWQTWNYLRSHLNRKPVEAARTVELMTRSLLSYKH